MHQWVEVAKVAAWLLSAVIALVLGIIYRRPISHLCYRIARAGRGQHGWEIAFVQPDSDQGPALETDLESQRKSTYAQSAGIFLVHQLRPSAEPGQLYDVGLFLVAHEDQTTGKAHRLGEVDRVEYQLGPRFGSKPIVIKDGRLGFRLNTSAHGPFVCAARVYFRDPQVPPVLLTRYVDFVNG